MKNSELTNFVKEQAKKLSSACDGVTNNKVTTKEYHIKGADLEDKYLLSENILDADVFKEMFSELKNNVFAEAPCLYYFEIEPKESQKISAEEIRKRVEEARKLGKKVPASNSNTPKGNTLYVGKVTACIWGRLIMHLGFHTNKNGGNPKESNAHGLHLNSWARDLNIKFVVIKFEKDMVDLMGVMENLLAKELLPIIGKHK